MAKVKRTYTPGEAAKSLAVSEEDVLKHLSSCAPDFAQREPHHLTQDEVNCIKGAISSQK
jgi:hypothetical protein